MSTPGFRYNERNLATTMSLPTFQHKGGKRAESLGFA